MALVGASPCRNGGRLNRTRAPISTRVIFVSGDIIDLVHWCASGDVRSSFWGGFGGVHHHNVKPAALIHLEALAAGLFSPGPLPEHAHPRPPVGRIKAVCRVLKPLGPSAPVTPTTHLPCHASFSQPVPLGDGTRLRRRFLARTKSIVRTGPAPPHPSPLAPGHAPPSPCTILAVPPIAYFQSPSHPHPFQLHLAFTDTQVPGTGHAGGQTGNRCLHRRLRGRQEEQEEVVAGLAAGVSC